MSMLLNKYRKKKKSRNIKKKKKKKKKKNSYKLEISYLFPYDK